MQGEDFTELAKATSECGSGINGGYMGPFGPDEMRKSQSKEL